MDSVSLNIMLSADFPIEKVILNMQSTKEESTLGITLMRTGKGFFIQETGISGVNISDGISTNF